MPATSPQRHPSRRDTVRRFDTEPVSLRLASDELERLDALGDRLERSRASLIREGVRLLLQIRTEVQR